MVSDDRTLVSCETCGATVVASPTNDGAWILPTENQDCAGCGGESFSEVVVDSSADGTSSVD